MAVQSLAKACFPSLSSAAIKRSSGGRGWGMAKIKFLRRGGLLVGDVQHQAATWLSAPTVLVLTEWWERWTEMA